MYTLVGAGIFTACFLTTSIQTFAAEKPEIKAKPADPVPGKEPEKAKLKRMPFRGRIDSVNPKEMTFVLPGKAKDRVFRVKPNTKLIKNGAPAKFADATVGEIVGGIAYVAADGPHEVISLRIGPKPDKAPPKSNGTTAAPTAN